VVFNDYRNYFLKFKLKERKKEKANGNK